MKKLISISVVLILLASAAFADVGATVIGSATLLQGENTEKADGKDGTKTLYTTKEFNSTDVSIGRIRLSASGALEDGTIGGALRYDSGSFGGTPNAWGWAFWKPSDVIKLQIGINPDGEFGLDGIGRWGFHQLAGDVGVVPHPKAWGGTWDWSKIDGQYGDAFFAGFDKKGLVLNITPVDGLAINVGIPIGSGAPAYREYKNSVIQVKYNIDGVGTAGLTYQGNQGEDEGKVKYGKPGPSTYVAEYDEDIPGWIIGKKEIPGTPAQVEGIEANNDNPSVIAYFGLSSIENVGIDIGIGYQFPDTYTEKFGDVTFTSTINNPISIGLGVSFSSGSFGVKTRAMGKFGGSTVTEYKDNSGSESATLADDFTVLFDILPYFAINETMTFYLGAGIVTKTGNEEEDKEKIAETGKFAKKVDNSAEFAWYVNPYISITPSYWSAAFFAGFRLESPNGYAVDDNGKPSGFFMNGDNNDVRNRIVKWSIPIGIIVNF